MLVFTFLQLITDVTKITPIEMDSHLGDTAIFH